MLIWVRMMIDLAAIQGSPVGCLCGPVSARMQWDLTAIRHGNRAWHYFWRWESWRQKSTISRMCSEDEMMVAVKQRKMSIYVDKSSGQWIVRDADGAFWAVPPDEEGWKHREPFTLTEETELEPVPGHYNYLLGLPR